MKISPRSFIIIFIAIIFFSSCKKDEEFSIEPSSIYYKSSIEKLGAIKIYTGNGEIKDQSIINRYDGLDSAWFTIRSKLYSLLRGQ